MIDKRDIQKLQQDAEDAGRESWWKAFLMDTNPEERAKVREIPFSLFSLSLSHLIRGRRRRLLVLTSRLRANSTRFWTHLDTRPSCPA